MWDPVIPTDAVGIRMEEQVDTAGAIYVRRKIDECFVRTKYTYQ